MELTIGQLEAALLSHFPSSDAEAWDRTGLIVGDPSATVSKVAVALDPTVSAIKEAANRGANVLVTHHPPFLDNPDTFKPAESVAQVSGAGVWTAVSNGVALMCFHTALDVSIPAQKMLPDILGLTQTGVLDKIPQSQDKGYGQICVIDEEKTMRLEDLASTCADAFNRSPRVWGRKDAAINSVVTGTGSGSNLCRPCMENAIDCLICGELKYHAALDLSEAGVSIIELGHDVSELPLTLPLRDAVEESGISPEDVVMIDQTSNWYAPAVR